MAARLFDKVEISVLAAVLIAVAGVWGFVELMAVARAVPPHAFDTQILLAFRVAGHPDTPLGPLWLQEVMRDITSLGSTIVLFLIMVAVAGYLLLIRRSSTALFVLFALIGGQALSSVLKLGVDRVRPDVVSHLSHVSTLSFPSGHAMMSAVTYLTLGLLAARFTPSRAIRIFLLAFAVLTTLMVGVSRLYLGVHWPSDVMAGWCAGFAWAMLCWLAARFWLRDRPLSKP